MKGLVAVAEMGDSQPGYAGGISTRKLWLGKTPYGRLRGDSWCSISAYVVAFLASLKSIATDGGVGKAIHY